MPFNVVTPDEDVEIVLGVLGAKWSDSEKAYFPLFTTGEGGTFSNWRAGRGDRGFANQQDAERRSYKVFFRFLKMYGLTRATKDKITYAVRLKDKEKIASLHQWVSDLQEALLEIKELHQKGKYHKIASTIKRALEGEGNEI